MDFACLGDKTSGFAEEGPIPSVLSVPMLLKSNG